MSDGAQDRAAANEVRTYVERVRSRTGAYPGCAPEQALVYACEDVVDSELGSPVLVQHQLTALIEQICWREDIEPPLVTRARAGSFRASADLATWTICFRERVTTASVLLHEMAHLSVGADSHGVLFRDELVRLVRAHVSVQHAAMLHTLFAAVDLEMSPWPASAHRR
jgi:hypothetical protein